MSLVSVVFALQMQGAFQCETITVTFGEGMWDKSTYFFNQMNTFDHSFFLKLIAIWEDAWVKSLNETR